MLDINQFGYLRGDTYGNKRDKKLNEIDIKIIRNIF